MRFARSIAYQTMHVGKDILMLEQQIKRTEPGIFGMANELKSKISSLSSSLIHLEKYVGNASEFVVLPFQSSKSEIEFDGIVCEEHFTLVVQYLRSLLANHTKQLTLILNKPVEKLRVTQKSINFPELATFTPSTAIDIYSDQQLQTSPDQIRRRGVSFQSVESTIHEIGGMFQELTKMVRQQGDSLQRIDQDIEDFSRNVEKAGFQLDRFVTNLSSDRKLMILLFFILIFIIFLWVKFFK